jgi:hypothetical protein
MTVKISASLLKDYLVCKRRAYYRIHEPEGSIQTKEMALGSAVHSVLEHYWESKEQAMLNVLPELSTYRLDTDLALIDKAYNLVAGFFELFPDRYFSDKDEVERYFKIPYSSDVYLTGKMDRVTEAGQIFDWKTSKSPPEDINRDPQFILYYLAYRMEHKREPCGVAYVSLLNRKLYYFTPNKGILSDFENFIIPDCISAIKKGDSSRTGLYAYKACDWCSFKSTCWSDLGGMDGNKLVRGNATKK